MAEENARASFLASCTSGGCGAKIGPGELAGVLAQLPRFDDPRLLVGFDSTDDAAVYQLGESTSLISTVDFFSPMVDDPRAFGRIAAANAMSDVWAMGGTPLLALNLVCFPEALDIALLGEVLAGGAEKVAEGGAVIGGGHSIRDKEPKYGLAVTGIIGNSGILRNNTAKAGDKLILTKPLGAGIVMAAHRASQASAQAVAAAVAGMERLNRYAAEKMQFHAVSACTDVTGFGLLGHLAEMTAGRLTARIWPEALPALPEAADYAAGYLLTGAGQRNREHLGSRVDVSSLPLATAELMFDPQTSGGLLIATAPGDADALLAEIRRDDPAAALIGEMLPPQQHCAVFAPAP